MKKIIKKQKILWFNNYIRRDKILNKIKTNLKVLSEKPSNYMKLQIRMIWNSYKQQLKIIKIKNKKK